MSLTNTTIRNVKPSDKRQRLFDSKGLYMEVAPSGGKWWRFKYRIDGKEKRISLGTYPDVSLSEARDNRDDARKLVSKGVDPSEHRKAQKVTRREKVTNNFENIAREWHTKQSPSWSNKHAETVLTRLENNIFPWLGSKPIADISAKDLLANLRRVEKRGAIETAHRVLGICGQVFRYAVATGCTERDISVDLKGALAPVKTNHLPAVTDPVQVGKLLRALDSYEGTLITKCALRLAPLVFVRPGELRKAEWNDIDLENAEWRFTVTKTNTPHIVPLSNQAIEILNEIKPLTGNGQYVFPSSRSRKRPMSDNAILAAMRRMSIEKEEMTGHGFRAMARTMLDEILGFRPDYIEHQLAHAVRDPNGRAYNRTAHLAERKRMMQVWADYLDKLKFGAEIVSINTNA